MIYPQSAIVTPFRSMNIKRGVNRGHEVADFTSHRHRKYVSAYRRKYANTNIHFSPALFALRAELAKDV